MVKKNNILIIGSGGREHALGWRMSMSPHILNIYFAPGNGGTSTIGKNIPIAIDDIQNLKKFAKENNIDLTIVGPELPLSLGIVDEFEKEGLVIFGPSKQAAQLESDKNFATEFMNKYKIPHPKSYIFYTPKSALAFFKSHKPSDYVIKAMGLASGKGVILPLTKQEAITAIKDFMISKIFGSAGEVIVVQEKIEGREVSVLAISDGKFLLSLLPSQDHKRLLDNNKGPNTGGMGAYAPVPFVTKELLQVIRKTILQKTINGMRKEGNEYKGLLYAGIMLTKNGPMVLEYNARFGDPETQPLMMLLESDLYELFIASISGDLKNKKIRFRKGAAICVVLAASGYPNSYITDKTIHGLKNTLQSNIAHFHAGTTKYNNKHKTSGGRVLGITAYGDSLEEASNTAYSSIGDGGIYFDNMQYRTDIGKYSAVE